MPGAAEPQVCVSQEKRRPGRQPDVGQIYRGDVRTERLVVGHQHVVDVRGVVNVLSGPADDGVKIAANRTGAREPEVGESGDPSIAADHIPRRHVVVAKTPGQLIAAPRSCSQSSCAASHERCNVLAVLLRMPNLTLSPATVGLVAVNG